MVRDVELTTKFMGMNIEQVDEYIQDLQKRHMDQVVEVKLMLENKYKDKENLYQELIDLQLEKERYNKSKELMELALIRAKEMSSRFSEASLKEINEILQQAYGQNEENLSKLDKIEDEIKITKTHIDSLLKNMMNVIQDQNLEGNPGINEQYPNKVVGKIFPATDKAKACSHAPSWQKGLIGPTNDKNISIPSQLSEEIPLEGKKQMTADGTVVTEVQGINKKAQSCHDYQRVVENLSKGLTNTNMLGTEQQQSTNYSVDNGIMEEGFWDEGISYDVVGRQFPTGTQGKVASMDTLPAEEIKLSQLLEEHELNEEIAATQERAVLEEEVSNNKQDININEMDKQKSGQGQLFNESLSEKQGSVEDNDDKKTAGLPGAGENRQVLEQKDNPQENQQKSPAIAEEIKNIRYKYIVGKIAGEDLVADDDSIIIAKKELITEATIEKAENAGKLAELIVNMQLPGMDD